MKTAIRLYMSSPEGEKIVLNQSNIYTVLPGSIEVDVDLEGLCGLGDELALGRVGHGRGGADRTAERKAAGGAAESN